MGGPTREKNVKRVKGIAALAVALTALAASVPTAGADTTWTKISTDYNTNSSCRRSD